MFLIIFSGELGEFCLNNSNLPGEELPNQAFVLDYVIFDPTDPILKFLKIQIIPISIILKPVLVLK